MEKKLKLVQYDENIYYYAQGYCCAKDYSSSTCTKSRPNHARDATHSDTKNRCAKIKIESIHTMKIKSFGLLISIVSNLSRIKIIKKIYLQNLPILLNLTAHFIHMHYNPQ